MGFLPPEISSVDAIFQIITDPQKTAAHLDALKKQHAELEVTLEAQREAERNAKEHRTAAEVALIETRKLHAQITTDLATQKAAQDSKDRELSATATTLAGKAQDLEVNTQKTKTDLDSRTTEVSRREMTADVREKSIAEMEARNSKLSDELEAKIKQLKSIIN